METNNIYQKVTELLGEIYGVEAEELTPESDLIEDIDLKSDVESLAKFVHSLNLAFDIEITAPEFSKALEAENITAVRDIVNTVEDAQLE